MAIARHVTKEDMQRALDAVNRKYEGNVEWHRSPEQIGKSGHTFRFTLKVKNSRRAGALIGYTGRHTTSACWHVHGDFYDALFNVAPQAEVTARGRKITKDEGNWEDFNVGSMMQPRMASEACEPHG